MLKYSTNQRWSVEQLAEHPFITGADEMSAVQPLDLSDLDMISELNQSQEESRMFSNDIRNEKLSE